MLFPLKNKAIHYIRFNFNFSEEAKINDTDESSEEDSIVEQSDILGKGGEKESLAPQVDQTSEDKRGIGQNRGLERAGR